MIKIGLTETGKKWHIHGGHGYSLCQHLIKKRGSLGMMGLKKVSIEDLLSEYDACKVCLSSHQASSKENDEIGG